jgi:hypothetical protein
MNTSEFTALVDVTKDIDGYPVPTLNDYVEPLRRLRARDEEREAAKTRAETAKKAALAAEARCRAEYLSTAPPLIIPFRCNVCLEMGMAEAKPSSHVFTLPRRELLATLEVQLRECHPCHGATFTFFLDAR